MYHVRGIVREIGEEINAVRRELQKMEEIGILKKEQRGNRIYFFVKTDYPLFGDLLSIISKSTGFGKALLDAKSKLGKVLYIMFSGRFTRHKKRKTDDEVEALVVGEIILPELASIVRLFESKLGREINYTVMSSEELEYRKKRKDPFLLGILAQSRTMIFGDEEGLVG